MPIRPNMLFYPPGSHVAALPFRGELTRLPAAAPASGSPSLVQHQTGSPQHDTSIRRQPPPKAVNANPSKEVEPSVLASFTSTDPEPEITFDRNRLPIQNGRKTLVL